MRLLMLASLLPAAMAEYDQCARTTGTWVGFDQGLGFSRTQAVTHSGNNVYAGGYAMGALSFGSRHANGDYSDHVGINQVHDTLSEVTIHHETETIVGTGESAGDNKNKLTSQLGQDAIIYKMTDAGMPVSVYAMDTMPSDGVLDGTGENGGWGGWSYINGIDNFDLAGETDQVVAVGMVRGSIKFPKTGGTPVELKNVKSGSYDPWVAKIDMAAGSVVWATKEGIDLPQEEGGDAYSGYPVSVVATAAGHVIATTRYWINRKYSGRLSKFNGLNGALVWSKNFGTELYQRYGKMSVDGETAYMTGNFKGKDSTAFAPLTTTSCEDGEGASVVVAAFDVSPSDAPVASWATVIGCGSRDGGSFLEGNYLYVLGNLASETALTPADGVAADTCKMTGALGGFLVKLNKADGKCVWAKDIGARGYAPRVVANADSVWTSDYSSSAVKLDAEKEIVTEGYDMILVKYRASDGAGLWGDVIGAEGGDRGYDMAMTPLGPIAVGSSDSAAIAAGAVTANNLQQTDAVDGQTAMFVIQMSMTDTHLPSCITNCPSGELSDATIAANNCYIRGKCLAHGAPFPGLTCFKCDANTDPKNLPENPDLTNHCYFGGKCVEAGAGAPHYTSYNSYSVCEVCQPAVDTTRWSIKPNYFHDRDHANDECWAPTRTKGGFNAEPGPCKPNNYGILFQRNSNGCQELPDVPLPATPSAALAAALAGPTSGAVADIGARAIKAITVTNTATTVDGTQLVSAWYHANQANCNGASGFEVDHDKDAATPKHKTGACKNTPAAHADEMASLFGTSMYYGHSVARIKVQQALAILDDDFKTGTVTAVKDDMKKDIVAHILVPMYQGAIKAAYDMDTASDKAAALAAGLAYWNLIHPNVPGFDAADKARLVALFGSAASGTHNYCEVKAILHRNLPDGSMLQYGQQVHQTMGSTRDDSKRPLHHASGLPTASLMHVPETSGKDGRQPKPISGELGVPSETEATEGVHIKERDIGSLVAAVDGGGEPKVCTYPPPAPPPPAPSSPPKSDSDSSLTDGEVAGVAIGAAIGGIVLLGVVGLILRSIMFKEAKPVFTCLEKAPAKSPA